MATTSTAIIEWTSDDVRNWMEKYLQLPDEAECFFHHNIDGPTLMQLTEEDIQSVMAEAYGSNPNDQPSEASRRLAIRKLLGHIHVLRLPISEKKPPEIKMPRTHRAAPPPRASDVSSARGPMTPRSSLGGYRNDAITPRSRSRFSVEFSSRTSELSRSRLNLGVKHAEVDSCFGVTKPSDSAVGSFARASLERKETRHTPGPSSYFGKYGREAPRKSAPATFAQARRHTDFLFSKGQTSPGVCKYKTEHFDPSKTRGGTIPKAGRWTSGKDVTPGPSSYQPRVLSLSTFR